VAASLALVTSPARCASVIAATSASAHFRRLWLTASLIVSL
jgi:hypothetical protein